MHQKGRRSTEQPPSWPKLRQDSSIIGLLLLFQRLLLAIIWTEISMTSGECNHKQ